MAEVHPITFVKSECLNWKSILTFQFRLRGCQVFHLS